MKRFLVTHSMLTRSDVFAGLNSFGLRNTLADARNVMRDWPRTEDEALEEYAHVRGLRMTQLTEHEVRDALNEYAYADESQS